jgi:hypothetical protein
MTMDPEPGSAADLDLKNEEARREAEYRARRKAERREEFNPMMVALVACGVAARGEKKAKAIAAEAVEIVEAIWAVVP